MSRKRTPEGQLTPRQAQVVARRILGQSYATIGEALFISPVTAEQHMAAAARAVGLKPYASTADASSSRAPTPSTTTAARGGAND